MAESTAKTYPRVLSIETATPVQAVALLDGTTLCEHRVQRVAYNHGSSLLSNIDDVLTACSFELADVDLFAVGIGPGSFTGLRVGLATAKALSRAVQRPIVGVSSLAALAYEPARCCPEATVLAAIDARRREVYAGAYRFGNGRLSAVIQDCAASPADWIDRVNDHVSGALIQLGDGISRYPALQSWKADNLRTLPSDLFPPSAVAVARLGRIVATTDGPQDRVQLEPNYIRPSDARLPDREPGPMPCDPDRSD